MKKILNLLEQKVQWLVFAAGLAYVLYMTWLYLISTPIKVNIAGEARPPGEVDALILEKAGDPLDQKMSETGTVTFSEKPASYVQAFTDSMNYNGKRDEVWSEALVLLPHGELIMPVGTIDDQKPDAALPAVAVDAGGPTTRQAGGGGQITRLPQIPAPKIVAARTGLTNVLIGAPTPPPQQGEPPAPPQGIDKSWVTVRFEIDPTSLAAEWDACKIPAKYSPTSFVQVVLQRQEQQSDGSWGKDTVIPPLSIHTPPSPWPDDNALPNVKVSYLQWASLHTADILQPTFFNRLKGDEWGIPGEEIAPAAGQPPFDPAKYVNATDEEKMKLTPEQRQEVQKLKDSQPKPATPAPARSSTPRSGSSTPRSGRGGGRRSGQQGLAPNMMPRTALYLYAEPGVDEPSADAPPEQQAAPAPAPAAPAAPVAMAGQGKFAIPAGDFDPHSLKASSPIIGWAHDDTAAPGVTYRYRVMYKMKNPVFAIDSLVKDLSLSKAMVMVSSPSEWSENVQVASTISFYIAGGARVNTNVFPVEVFRWKGGEPKSKSYNVGPGDVIGAVEGDVDFATGWSVVDVRIDPRGEGEAYILLMDPQGNLRKRDQKTDSMDPRYQKLKQEASSSAAGAVSSAVGAK